MYMACPPREGLAELSSQQEAEHLANFGHKYGVQSVLHASDAYMHTVMQKQCPLDPSCHQEYLASWASDRVPEVLKVCSFSESNGLPQTLAYCSKWLGKFIMLYPKQYPELVALNERILLPVVKSMLCDCVVHQGRS